MIISGRDIFTWSISKKEDNTGKHVSYDLTDFFRLFDLTVTQHTKKQTCLFFDSSHKYFSTLSASQRDGSCQSSSFLPSKHTTVNVSVCDGGIEKESEEATEQEVHPGLVCHLTSF